jgi:pimeloyl-ACP methyl ester carboxylesterase
MKIRTPAAAVAAALLVAACSSGPAGDQADRGAASGAADLYGDTPKRSIDWRACEGGFNCGTLEVPLDHADPDGEQIKLAVIRKQATGPNRIGSLVINPGGPGGSGLEMAQYAAVAYPREVRERYDIVGFDPRGVGRSTPVTCLDGPATDEWTQVDQTPDDPAEEAAAERTARTYGQACQARSGRLLGHVSTADAARDMDILRAALGDRKLHYVGYSYGTFLGATYAELYPARVGRLVLDGATDPSQPAVVANRVQAGGFETALAAFADDCVAAGACFLGDTREAVVARVQAFLRGLDTEPLPGDATRRVTESIATMGVIQALYAKEMWPDLRLALRAGLRGDGSRLLELSDDYYRRAPDGSYSNLMAANAAVNCLDGPPAATTTDQVKALVPEYERASPTFGRALAWAGLGCGEWPVPPTGTPHEIRARGADPILVVGTTRDPATPYSWARALAGQLDSGRLLTYDGDGHTAYLRGSSCVDAAVGDYLLKGTLPAEGKSCD